MNTADWIALGVVSACVLLYIVWPKKKPAPAKRNTIPPVPISVGPATGAAFALQAAAPVRRTYGARSNDVVVHHVDHDDSDNLVTGIVIGAAIESLMDTPSYDSSSSSDSFSGGGGDFGGGGASGSWD